MRYWVGIFLAVVILGSSCGEPLGATSAAIGGRPGSPRSSEPRSQSIFIHTLEKGGVVNDSLLVVNNSDKEQTLGVYVVDAAITNTGAFTCEQQSEVVDATGTWITPQKKQVTLGSKQNTTVGLVISAPKDAAVGEHNACVVIEPIGGDDEQSNGLRLRTRSAIRAAFTIPGELRRNVSISSYDVSQDGNSLIHNIVLQNDGNVSADVRADAMLKNIMGVPVYRNGGEYPVLAGKNLDLLYKNTEPPLFGGWYFATASIEYNEKAGTFGVDAAEKATMTKTSERLIFIAPQPVVLLLELGFAGILLVATSYYVMILRARRTWTLQTIKKGDDLQLLAKRHGTHWRRVAKVNRLKAPYSLEPGKKLRLPRKLSENLQA